VERGTESANIQLSMTMTFRKWKHSLW
jgi:hypothetical protein